MGLATQSTLSRLTFGWVTPLLARGMQRPLQQEDLFELQPDLQPSACSQRLWVCAACHGDPSHVQRKTLTDKSPVCAHPLRSTRQHAPAGIERATGAVHVKSA